MILESALLHRLKSLVWSLIKKILLFFFISTVLVTVIYRFVPVYVTPLMIYRSAQKVVKGEFPTWHKTWMPIDKISGNMVDAVVASEDGKFMTHHGFDWKSMALAFENNNNGKKIVGGSTISQQTAKNVFLWQGRSYVRKVLEAYFTVLIETIWSKERIMEVYLNVIEMGDDSVFGVQAASEIHFNKDAANLTKGQAALIAASLPNPHRFDAGHPNAYLWKHQSLIMKRMRKMGHVKLKG